MVSIDMFRALRSLNWVVGPIKSMDSREAQSGIVVESLEPFYVKVRLESGEVVLCGFERSYFGRVLPEEALERLQKHGPHPGDHVSVRISESMTGEMRHGVILRQSEN